MGAGVAIAAALVILAGLAARRKTRRAVIGEAPVVTDEVLRRVLEEGSVDVTETDEPLDEDQIREAEDEFWTSEWDDAEPWSG